jgi:WD40 repeat protein
MNILKFCIYLFASWVLIACAASPPVTILTPAPANLYTGNYLRLDTQAAGSLTEIVALEVEEHSTRVIAVQYLSDTNRVLAVYEGDGSVIGWDVDTKTTVFEYDLHIASAKALLYIKSRNWLIGATEHLFKSNRLHRSIEYVNGLAIWDVNTGELISCVTYPCQQNSSGRDGYLGAAVDANGRWLYIFTEVTYELADLSNDKEGPSIGVNDLDAPYQWNIGAIAAGGRHDRYAIVFQEGRIGISAIDDIRPYHILAEGKEGELGEIKAAKFDPSGRWLAIVRDNYLSVWQVEDEQAYFEDEVKDFVELIFDQTGQLLIVASENKISTWSLDTKTRLAEYQATGITALSLSDDDRLLIWGDQNGQVHLWGIPTQ